MFMCDGDSGVNESAITSREETEGSSSSGSEGRDVCKQFKVTTGAQQSPVSC